MKNLGPILLIVGLVLILLGVAQHFLGLIQVDHLAIIVGILGIIALLPGAWFTMQSRNS